MILLPHARVDDYVLDSGLFGVVTEVADGRVQVRWPDGETDRYDQHELADVAMDDDGRATWELV